MSPAASSPGFSMEAMQVAFDLIVSGRGVPTTTFRALSFDRLVPVKWFRSSDLEQVVSIK